VRNAQRAADAGQAIVRQLHDLGATQSHLQSRETLLSLLGAGEFVGRFCSGAFEPSTAAELNRLLSDADAHGVSLLTEIIARFLRPDIAPLSLAFNNEKLLLASRAASPEEQREVLLAPLGRPEVITLTATAAAAPGAGLYLLDKDGTGNGTRKQQGQLLGPHLGKAKKDADVRRLQQGGNGGSLTVGVPAACMEVGPLAEALFEGLEALATVAVGGSVACLPGCDQWGSPTVVSSKDPKKQAENGESRNCSSPLLGVARRCLSQTRRSLSSPLRRRDRHEEQEEGRPDQVGQGR
jgi:hypothetical protein